MVSKEAEKAGYVPEMQKSLLEQTERGEKMKNITIKEQVRCLMDDAYFKYRPWSLRRLILRAKGAPDKHVYLRNWMTIKQAEEVYILWWEELFQEHLKNSVARFKAAILAA